jgi:hypothetical protein
MRCDPACPKGQQCFNGVCGAPKEGCNITSQNNCTAMKSPFIPDTAATAWSTSVPLLLFVVTVAAMF